MTRLALAIALLCASLHAGTVAAAPTAHDAWIALGPPDSTAFAGYLTLFNPDAKPNVLVAVSSPAFGAIELHRTVRHGDGMRMVRLTELPLPPGAATALAPGAAHLMLFRPQAALAADQRLTLTLHFADGTTLTVEAEVRDPRAAAAPHHHGGTG